MNFYKVFLSGVFLLSAMFSDQCIRNGPKGRIVSSRCSHTIGLIDGEPDAGINIEISVKNEGKAGTINVGTTLSSSEGEFSRNQSLHFRENERKDLKFLIHEVTINASNLECRGKVSPEAD